MFRLEVDHAAYPAAGGAVQQAIGTLKDLDAIDQRRVHHLARHHARQPAEGHIVAIQRKAADAVGFGEVAVALQALHARVIFHHVGDSFRLPILDHFRGEANNVERHLHGALLAQHAETAAVGHLAIKISRHQLVAAGFEVALRRGGDGQDLLVATGG